MPAVAYTKQVFPNQVEYFGANLDAANDYLEVPAHASTYTVLANITGEDIACKISVVCGFDSEGPWFPLDTEQTITDDGQYIYFFTGKPASSIRLVLTEVTTGEPVVSPVILVASNT
jgi:hypothetical protein